MRDITRQLVEYDDRLGRTVQFVLDVVVAHDLLGCRHVESTLAELDAAGQLQAAEHGLYLALAALLGDRVDLARDEQGADENRALFAAAQSPRIEDAALVDVDLEAGRDLELGKLVGGGRHRRCGNRGHFCAGPFFGFALGPEGLLFFLFLGMDDAGDSETCCKDGDGLEIAAHGGLLPQLALMRTMYGRRTIGGCMR